jgi:hypothetical protein
MRDGLVLIGRFYIDPKLILEHEYRRNDDGSVRLILSFGHGVTVVATGGAVGGVARSLGLPESPYPGPRSRAANSGAIWRYGDDRALLEEDPCDSPG